MKFKFGDLVSFKHRINNNIITGEVIGYYQPTEMYLVYTPIGCNTFTFLHLYRRLPTTGVLLYEKYDLNGRDADKIGRWVNEGELELLTTSSPPIESSDYKNKISPQGRWLSGVDQYSSSNYKRPKGSWSEWL